MSDYVSSGVKMVVGEIEAHGPDDHGYVLQELAARSAYFSTKKALREALVAAPDTVLMVTFGIGSSTPLLATELVKGTKYQVAGPDPERRRNWYTVIENRDGVLFMDQKAVQPR